MDSSAYDRVRSNSLNIINRSEYHEVRTELERIFSSTLNRVKEHCKYVGAWPT